MDWQRADVSVPTRAPTGSTAAYVCGDEAALLVDPADTDDALDSLLNDRTLAHIAVTHHHPDHAGAVAHYARETNATVWARRGRASAFEAATGVSPDRLFSDGTTIPTDVGRVTVLDTPGHAPEHVAFTTDGTVVSGDLAVAEGSVVVGAPEGDVRAYLTSLRRLHARNPDMLLPSHGPRIENPRETCARLIDHRLERERRVRAAVNDGADTLEEVLDGAYEKDLTGVRDLARATVLAHLEKLAVEGAISWDGERALPNPVR
ncbi:MBL fold metallo-hydrolase [Haloarcula sp. CBA1130]|uniref:MBL fold metallo-hydrolase n=1 Tax=unclassified Haloarcula TaxID=2624677 RepID=UPI001245B834|nr:MULTISPECIES: MBL fold metallo-hydrolase [unclassified Haloarcula]KAA9396855.1 MBL fold metallo-hydrolase [Haloarcula sp. CBA1129]KAA9401815.1 MBL fold metallo-hydrolase [Haloarcula sp. CBA1130]